MLELIVQNMSIVWLALMVLLLIIEAATAGLTCIWFALGALAALIAALFLSLIHISRFVSPYPA